MTQTSQIDAQTLVLTALLSLHERVRPVGLQELKFISVNELKSLFDYTHGVLLSHDGSKCNIEALSSVTEVEQNVPYTLFLKECFKTFYGEGLFESTAIKPISSKDIKKVDVVNEWGEWLPNNLLLIPLPHSKFSLIIAKKKGWSDRDIAIAEKVQPLFDQEFLQKEKAETPLSQKPILKKIRKSKLYIAGAIAVLLLFPFRVSVLAPAEIIPLQPSIVRAPLEGIIKSIEVDPNQVVSKGDVLFTYDKNLLQAQIEASQSALKVAQSELRQVSQEALSDSQARLKLTLLQGDVQRERYSLGYAQSLLERAEVFAPSDGVVIFEDVFDWLGRSVSIGEKVMTLAEGDKTQLEIRLPVHDNIGFEEQSDIRFFSNARPDRPLKATLSHHSYRATNSDVGEVSYKLKASWLKNEDEESIRIGLKGSAKIYGKRSPLILQILRRPLIEVRQWLGI